MIKLTIVAHFKNEAAVQKWLDECSDTEALNPKELVNFDYATEEEKDESVIREILGDDPLGDWHGRNE